ncbi:hypothetical protein Tco_1565913, partial [Tanacetum coccineum]
VVGCLWGVELLIGVVVHVHTSNFNLWWSSSVQLGINGRMVMMLVILARGNDNHAKLCYWDRFVHVILVNGSLKVLNGGRASVIVSGLVVIFLVRLMWMLAARLLEDAVENSMDYVYYTPLLQCFKC